jgi:hypothetical protein
VSLPSSYKSTNSTLFESFKDDVVSFKISNDKVSVDERTNLKATIKIPLFTSNDASLCPLTYIIISDATQTKEVKDMTGLTVKSDGVEFSFSLSSSLAKETEFYLKAINPDGLSVTSPKMKITSSPICDSYTSVI